VYKCGGTVFGEASEAKAGKLFSENLQTNERQQAKRMRRKTKTKDVYKIGTAKF